MSSKDEAQKLVYFMPGGAPNSEYLFQDSNISYASAEKASTKKTDMDSHLLHANESEEVIASETIAAEQSAVKRYLMPGGSPQKQFFMPGGDKSKAMKMLMESEMMEDLGAEPELVPVPVPVREPSINNSR